MSVHAAAHSAGLPRLLLADGAPPGESFTFSYMLLLCGLLFGLLTLVYVLKAAFGKTPGEIGGWELRGAGSRIRAIARTTFAEGMRAKVGSGFSGIILISIPLFWLTASGDGTIKGQVQMFMSYSLGLSGFLLALLTIFFSCRSLSIEIASRQIYSVVSKPIPRWQIVAGKWIGVMALNAILLGIAAAATYAGVQASVWTFKRSLAHDLTTYGGVTPDKAEAAVAALENVRGVAKEGLQSPIVDALCTALGMPAEKLGDMLLKLPENTRANLRRFDELRRQVLVARAAIPVPIPDLSEEVRKEFERLKAEKALPADQSDARIREQIYAALVGSYITIPYGPQNARQWTVKGPPPRRDRDAIMSVRFKIHASGQLPAGTFMGQVLEEDTLLCLWGIGDARKPEYLETLQPYPVNTTYEQEIPASAVQDDGTVILTFANADPRMKDAVIDLPNGGLEVLYYTGPFISSLIQSTLAMLIPLACLAAFGVCASTFLTFPVGSLIVVFLYIISSSIGFVAESFAATKDYVGPHTTLEFEVRKGMIDGLGWALAIGDTDPVSKLIEGRAIGWDVLWSNFWRFVLVKGAIIFALAVMVLRRRELATVTV